MGIKGDCLLRPGLGIPHLAVCWECAHLHGTLSVCEGSCVRVKVGPAREVGFVRFC